jgi:hypothetical protein
VLYQTTNLIYKKPPKSHPLCKPPLDFLSCLSPKLFPFQSSYPARPKNRREKLINSHDRKTRPTQHPQPTSSVSLQIPTPLPAAAKQISRAREIKRDVIDTKIRERGSSELGTTTRNLF